MNTLIQYAEDGAIQAVSHFDVVSDFVIPSNCLFVEPGSYGNFTDFELVTECRIVDGKVFRAGKKPSEAHVWNPLTLTYEVDFALAREAAWREVKTVRLLAEQSGFDWDGSRFDSDQLSQSRIQAAVLEALLSDDSFRKEWKLADNSFRSLDKQAMLDMGRALTAHLNSVHNRAQTLKTAIDAADSLEALLKIKW